MRHYYEFFCLALAHAIQYDDSQHIASLEKTKCDCGALRYGIVVRDTISKEIVCKFIECKICRNRCWANETEKLFLSGETISYSQSVLMIGVRGLKIERSLCWRFFRNIEKLSCDGKTVNLVYSDPHLSEPTIDRICTGLILHTWWKLRKRAEHQSAKSTKERPKWSLFSFINGICRKIRRTIQSYWDKIYEYKGLQVRLRPQIYTNGRLALYLEPVTAKRDFFVLTKNLKELNAQGLPDRAYVDIDNEPEALNFLEANGLATNTGYTRRSGWVQYPMVKLNRPLIYQHDPEMYVRERSESLLRNNK